MKMFLQGRNPDRGYNKTKNNWKKVIKLTYITV